VAIQGEHTLEVSQNMPSLARSLEIYWDLEDLPLQVVEGKGQYAELNTPTRLAFQKGQAKHVKYMEKLD
jgi:hypothetical protein